MFSISFSVFFDVILDLLSYLGFVVLTFCPFDVLSFYVLS